jgi:hypothetical protein
VSASTTCRLASWSTRPASSARSSRRRCASPSSCDFVTAAAPDGHEVEAPIVYIETASEHTVDQAIALADAIRDMVQGYGAAGDS